MHNHSYENEFNLHVNEISFSREKMSTKTRFEEEAKGNSEMELIPEAPSTLRQRNWIKKRVLRDSEDTSNVFRPHKQQLPVTSSFSKSSVFRSH